MNTQIFSRSGVLLTLMILLSAPKVFAHEGHDHDAPAMVQAPKGGMIKSVEAMHIEVIAKKTEIKIYVYDKDLKAMPLEGVVVTAQTKLPRAKKSEDLALKAMDGGFEANFDAKGAHRYSLILSVKDPRQAHADKLTFNLEPKK